MIIILSKCSLQHEIHKNIKPNRSLPIHCVGQSYSN
uniref:Uncharacterized protein n=1 Tax=Rhizophora mucronata TaxID=61149 RepID=A0A2P2IXN1_RHIMU